jgi:hypothetical protein
VGKVGRPGVGLRPLRGWTSEDGIELEAERIFEFLRADVAKRFSLRRDTRDWSVVETPPTRSAPKPNRRLALFVQLILVRVEALPRASAS